MLHYRRLLEMQWTRTAWRTTVIYTMSTIYIKFATVRTHNLNPSLRAKDTHSLFIMYLRNAGLSMLNEVEKRSNLASGKTILAIFLKLVTFGIFLNSHEP